MLAEVEAKSLRLVEAEEEVVFLKDELVMENESQVQSIDALQDKCGKLAKQNITLVQRLNEMEQELEELEKRMKSQGRDKAYISFNIVVFLIDLTNNNNVAIIP